MEGNFTQSEAGNITVLSLGNNLLIWVDEKTYIITNPSTTSPVYLNDVGTLDFPSANSKTLEQLKSMIDDYFESKKVSHCNPV